MAEAFGVVASAISILSLLEHIITSIEKLKALRAFIKSIPRELEDLIEEIEIVQGVLQTLTPDMFDFMNIPLTQRRLSSFQSDLEVLIREIEKYRIAATGRRIAMVKLALKRDEIRAQRQNLDNIKGTLLLLQQAYCSASLRELGSIIRTQTSQTSKLKMEAHKQNDQSLYQTRRGKTQRNEQQTWKLQLRTPLIVIDKFWNFQLRRLYSGWTFSIRSCNIVPRNAPIWDACWKGDVEEVQRLFSAGLATPLDCDDLGRSILSHAAYWHELEVCQLLLENGADPDHTDHGGLTALQYYEKGFCARSMSGGLPDTVSPDDICWLRTLIDASKDCYDPFEDLGQQEDPWGRGLCGPPEILTFMQQQTFDNYASLPLQFRFERAMALSSTTATSSMIEIALGGGIEPDVFDLNDKYNRDLLDKIIVCMGVSFGFERERALEWRPLFSDAIAACTDVNKTWLWERGTAATLLLMFLQSYVRNWRAIRRLRYDFNPILQKWVTELKLAGVDLETYGATEQLVHETDPLLDLEVLVYVGPLRSYSWFTSESIDVLPFRILKIAYGPEPEDWRIWVTNPIDELVGEFWEMVEREEEVMPGSWVD
ncbi:ankyrin repeat domain-containing protein [Aspergillus mulundensis]|uniref:Uncharacterized protein n=1 Tax=Aspergillus mulundensis TaxID=1810919 RepID=A0A3D8QSF5_9EURO|nr:hypothetical protein DSM5745_09835 [Aspergillus mulundensis]RDW64424.1 hypothetical protein DSM5745_09835 [Aspergillus mulundensis]